MSGPLGRAVTSDVSGDAGMDRAREHDVRYRRRWWTLAVLSLSVVVVDLDNTILHVAIPTLQAVFGSSSAELQWMVDAYVVAFAGLLLPMGALGDRLGRARALQAGLLIFGVGSAAAAVADSGTWLIGARAVMGGGAALMMPATLAVLVDVFPREERGRAIGAWAAIAGVGLGLGPLLGGVLIEYFDWRAVFLVNLPIVAMALGAGLVLVPDSRDPSPPPLDVPGAALSIGGVTLLIFAIIEAPARGWGDPAVLGAFAAALALGGAFLARETRTPHPLLDLGYFRDPRFAGGALAVSVAFFALFGMVFGFTQYLQLVQGHSALEAGLRTAPIALGLMIGAGVAPQLTARLGTMAVVVAGLVMLALALGSMTLWTPATSYAAVGPTIVLVALAMGLIVAPAADAVMGATREAQLGVGSAIHDVTRQVAGALGVAVVGSAIAAIYARRIEVATATLPSESRAGARDSLGGALDVAGSLPAEAGTVLADAARIAFSEAFGLAVLVGVGVALVGALAVSRLLPPREGARAAAEQAPTTHDDASDAQGAVPAPGWLRDLGRQALAPGPSIEAHDEEASSAVGRSVGHAVSRAPR